MNICKHKHLGECEGEEWRVSEDREFSISGRNEDRKIEVWVFSRDFKTRNSAFGGFQFRLREASETKMA